ncbi:hypothetical protein HQ533_03385 [Candidatus Woesearchaeota archaeon]|nr:hypothetical protein [Candidatus Woesearchaeota archaeon]
MNQNSQEPNYESLRQARKKAKYHALKYWLFGGHRKHFGIRETYYLIETIDERFIDINEPKQIAGLAAIIEEMLSYAYLSTITPLVNRLNIKEIESTAIKNAANYFGQPLKKIEDLIKEYKEFYKKN